MKKILSALIMSALIVGMAGCGKTSGSVDYDLEGFEEKINNMSDDELEKAINDGANKLEEAIKVTTTSASTTVETTVTTTTTTTTTTTVTEEEPEIIPYLTRQPTNVGAGYLAIGDRAINPNPESKDYFYDMVENKMIEFDSDMFDSINTYFPTFSFTYGNSGCYESRCFAPRNIIKYSDSEGQTILNFTTGEELIKLNGETSFIIDNNYSTSTLLIAKIEESFTGNTISLGVLGMDGEWIYPMSSDYSICKKLANFAYYDLQRSLYYYSSDVIAVNNYSADEEYFYSFKEDKEIVLEDEIISQGNVINVDNEYIYYYKRDDNGDWNIHKYEFATGKELFVNKRCDVCYMYCGHRKNSDGNCMTYNLYDDKFNCVTFDISQYVTDSYDIQNVVRGGSVEKEKLVLVVKNPAGNYYLAVINPDGSTVTEPVKLESSYIDSKLFFKGDVLIGTDFIYNLSTGDFRANNNDFSICSYDTASGLCLVYTNHPENGNSYYLIDPENPDTLINPFETTMAE